MRTLRRTRTRLFSPVVLATAALALIASPLVATAGAQTIGTLTADNGAGQFGRDSFDAQAFGAFAQTFVTPTGFPLLQSFSFLLGDYIGGADLRFEASVYQFATDHIVGPSLYTSGVRTGSSIDSGDYDTFAFPMPVGNLNLALTPGVTYAFVLRTAATSADGATNFLGTTLANSYTGGALFVATGSDVAALGANGAFSLASTSQNSYGADAAFRATFGSANASVVPEPSTVVLLAAGLAGMLVLVRRRRA